MIIEARKLKMITNKKHIIFADEYILSNGDAIASYQKDIDLIFKKLLYNATIIDKSIPQRGYYVYGIFKNNKIWYIGKGKKNRVLTHFYKSSNNSINNEIIQNKNNLTYSILYNANNEKEAYEVERQLINRCKISNIELCNVIYNKGTRQAPIYKLVNTLKMLPKISNIPKYNIIGLTECVNMILHVIRTLSINPIIINGIDITKIKAEKIIIGKQETYKYIYI